MVLNISTEVLERTATKIDRSTEISKILSAAVINKQFRDTLLNYPSIAIERGFDGQNFYLTENEKAVIGSIHATNLTDFSKSLLGYLN